MPGIQSLRDSAFNLGVARIIIFAALWFSVEQWAGAIERTATMPPEMLDPPRIMKDLIRWVPPNRDGVVTGLWVLRGACVLGLIGLWSRTASLVACLLSVYLFGLLWCFGATSHKMHHFPLLLAILAASPCGEAASIDSVRRRVEPGGWGLAFGLPLRCMGISFGLIYFFPGLWKLTGDALGWIDGSCMRSALWRAWWGDPELVRIDLWPGALQVAGTLMLAFEVLFLPLVFWRAARPWLAVMGVLFHVAVYALMSIDFLSLAMCLLVLVDWDTARRRGAHVAGAGIRDTRAPDWRAVATLVGVCAVAWAFMIKTGRVDQERTWPISAYPSFRWAARPGATTTMAVRVDADGHEEQIDDDVMGVIFGSNWAKTRQELRVDWLPKPRSDDRRRAFLRYWARMQGVDDLRSTLRLYTVAYSTDPDDRGRPPVSVTLLCESPAMISSGPGNESD